MSSVSTGVHKEFLLKALRSERTYQKLKYGKFKHGRLSGAADFEELDHTAGEYATFLARYLRKAEDVHPDEGPTSGLRSASVLKLAGLAMAAQEDEFGFNMEQLNAWFVVTEADKKFMRTVDMPPCGWLNRLHRDLIRIRDVAEMEWDLGNKGKESYKRRMLEFLCNALCYPEQHGVIERDGAVGVLNVHDGVLRTFAEAPV